MTGIEYQRINPFENPDVAALFAAYPNDIRDRLLAIRRLIFDTATDSPVVGKLEETLKWNQPAYLTRVTESGSTIRIDKVKYGSADYAMYFHCQTTLVDTFRLKFGDLRRYDGNRALLFRIKTIRYRPK